MSNLKDAIANKISSLTRFDIKDIQILEDRDERINVKLNFLQKYSYTKKLYTISGQNHSTSPSSIACSSTDELQLGLSRELALAQNNASSAISTWINNAKPAIKKTVEYRDVFTHTPKVFFKNFVCSTCNGNRQLTCFSCAGKKFDSCVYCSGRGKRTCLDCGGYTTTNCYSCSGRGYNERIVTKQVWNYVTSSYDLVSDSERENCISCNSSGKKRCYSCDASGNTQCSFCSGDGKVACRICSGRGLQDCNYCDATGYKHHLGMIDVEFNASEKFIMDTNDQRLKEFTETLSSQRISRHYELNNVDYQQGALQITTYHDLKLPVSTLNFKISEREFTIYGFGSQKEIYDYDNIIGYLLSEDLKSLEFQSKKSSAFFYQSNKDFAKSMTQFLSSEVNETLLDRNQANNLNELNNVIDEKYISDAKNAIENGLFRYSKSLNIMLSCWLSFSIILGLDTYNIYKAFQSNLAHESFLNVEWPFLTLITTIEHIVIFIPLALISIQLSYMIIKQKCGLRMMSFNDLKGYLGNIGLPRKKFFNIYLYSFVLIEIACNYSLYFLRNHYFHIS